MSGNEDELFLDHDTTEEDLSAQLPSFMPKDPDSGNYQLLSTIAERIDHTKGDIESVDRALTVQHADTIAQLEQLADLVDLDPNPNEGREHYRARVIAEFQLVTSEGTIQDLLSAASTILDVEPTDITYAEQHTTSAGFCSVTVPSSRLSALQMSESEFADILNQTVPSSYRVDVLKEGTFTYLSLDDYSGSGAYDSSGLNSDADLGHDGLDVNDDPKNNGGTYAGLLS